MQKILKTKSFLDLMPLLQKIFFPQKVIFLKGDENLIKERLSQKEQDAIEKRGIDYFLSVQDKLENTLYFLKEKINLQVLTLNANDTKENLHQKIKDFLQ